MALRQLPVRPLAFTSACRAPRTCLLSQTRSASTTSSPSKPSSQKIPDAALSGEALELAREAAESDPNYSSLSTPSPTSEQISSYDPIARAKARESQLPPSRFKYRSPRYYRGPLHPHQPPPPSNPTSRLYVPGPFSMPRLSQTYDATLSHDLMVLGYQHVPYGTPKPPPKQRLRGWDDSSPYHKNRPLRAPRGVDELPLLVKPITFRNVPILDKISVSILLKEGGSNSATTHAAGMLLQAITTQRATVHMAKKGMAAGQRISFTQKEGKPIAVGTTMSGETMWHFLSTFTTFVLPRIKEWKGVKARSGDRSGNYTIGLAPETVEGWPELVVNYDAYPPQMIPGLDVTLRTTATNDRDGKLLLASLGIPFDATGQ